MHEGGKTIARFHDYSEVSVLLQVRADATGRATQSEGTGHSRQGCRIRRTAAPTEASRSTTADMAPQ